MIIVRIQLIKIYKEQCLVKPVNVSSSNGEAQDWEWDGSFGFGHVENTVVGDVHGDARRRLHMNLMVGSGQAGRSV